MAEKTVAVRLTVRAGEYVRGMQQAGQAANQFAVQAEQGANRAASASRSLGIASAVSGKAVLLGIGGAMAVSAQAAIVFESALTGVAKTTNLAGPALDAMGESLRNMSMTRVPMNVNDLAKLAEIGGQLGIQVPNLIDFTGVVAKMGVATNLAGEDAATGLARMANVMGTNQSDIERLGSSLVELGNNFATTESEILTFALRLAPVATTVGLTEGQVLGLSAAMSSLGIPAERGGTALQRVFIDMKSAVDSGGEAVAGFAEIAGMASSEFAELFKNDPSAAFASFVAGLDRVAKSGDNVFLALDRVGIAEQRTIQSLLAAAEGHELIAEAMQMGADAFDENIALNEEAARRFGTTASQVEFLKNQFNDLRIEFGQMILGSGGLQFGMEMLGEFFDIIKNNAGAVNTFVKVLGGLAILQLGKGFATLATNATEAVGKIQAATTKLSTMTTVARAGAIAMGILNVAMNVAVGVAGILVTVWAMQAAKAAELRQAVRALNQEIEAGADPIDAFLGAMRTSGDLTGEMETVISTLGVSIRDFSEAVLSGEDAGKALLRLFNPDVDLEDTMSQLETIGEMSKILQEAGIADSNSFFGNVTAREIFIDIAKAMEDSEQVAGRYADTIRNNVKQALIDAQIGVDMTTESFDGLVDEIIKLGGLSISPEAALAYARDLTGISEDARLAARVMGSSMEDAAAATEKSWREALLNMEDGADVIDNFFDDISDATDGFSEGIDDEFSAVNDTVMGGVPGWEEYSSKVELSMRKVRKSFEDYIDDVTAWVGVQDTVLAHASEPTLAWLDEQGTAVQAYLASLPEDELIGFITDTNAGFADLAVQQTELWGTRLPGAVSDNLPQLLGAITTAVDAMGLTGAQAMEAFNEALASVMGKLSPEEQQQVKDQVDAAMAGVDWYQTGNKVAVQISDGFIAGLWAMDSEAARMAQRVKNTLTGSMDHEFQMQSPSKLMREKGLNVAYGFTGGIEQGMRGVQGYFSPQAVVPSNYGSMNGGNTTTNYGNTTITIPIDAGDREIRHEIEKGLVYMGKIVNLVESGAGRR